MCLLLAFFVILSSVAGISNIKNYYNVGQKQPKEITQLPGLDGKPISKQFSGYVTVDKRHDRSLFYWVVHSERDVNNDPVVLWLTGGPGCSSMDAFIYEHGPFKFSFKGGDDGADIVLEENPYSWSKVATMIYVDSPAGTGLSYSRKPQDYSTDNERTVEDLYSFLVELFTMMPELSYQGFYIAGESYGGVYVPLLASKILNMSRSQRGMPINLRGYMTGNGVTDDVIESAGQLEFAYGMGLIDPLTFHRVQEDCKGNYWDVDSDSACALSLKKAYDIFYWVNPYDTLLDCYLSAQKDEDKMTHSAHKDVVNTLSWKAQLGHTVPCANRRVALKWLSLPEVRQAIHAVPVQELSWQPCSDILNYTINTPVSMINTHKELLHAGLSALVYSGDHDFIIPFTATRTWVYGMGLHELSPYSAWKVDDQVAGFTVSFTSGLTFATIKGAGHMAPQTNPKETLHLISRFLDEFR
ncbi:hypothetical protein CEUSTIGMA_g2844.t1 [Chlamydomonas eustigma]|uniref:Carboxypeptidase n=1 Tax=Chlamydomonas eustigma TaxID=1157962 RepID=A0A250WY02_9CHLO|nr:hypothetical protein CEUSTIGMA_g2844.t1 [Chlamydomonas eustigma]|eukprot:GAX75400.1 hypothetical protein CEUSTIGMA_g2844.t1 [Chlamydomonas eustigma]